MEIQDNKKKLARANMSKRRARASISFASKSSFAPILHGRAGRFRHFFNSKLSLAWHRQWGSSSHTILSTTSRNISMPSSVKIMGINKSLQLLSIVLVCCFSTAASAASSGYGTKVNRNHTYAPPAPLQQTEADVLRKSTGCVTCHVNNDQPSMHANPAVKIGCVDCHGGDSEIALEQELDRDSAEYVSLMNKAHILPDYPEAWNFPSSANPERTYTLLNVESREFVRFVNPSDYRVATDSCGACHQEIIEAQKRSLHSTGAMLLGGAAYNNGILPFKNYVLGEAYDDNGEAITLVGPDIPEELQQAAADAGIVKKLFPLTAWETVAPGDVFRVFERGGRNISNLFPETAIPNALGLLQRLEEPGRPDIRQSNRGPGTGARIAVPLINITKTRLNDPLTWFSGTNDQPGDYRNSGCSACHSVYANDRDPAHSGPYAKFGRDGTTQTGDPTIPKDEVGHPLKHEFTRAIPTSQCMVCHMHQPNMFLNTYMGYTMWDYESDAPRMWPEEQQYPTASEEWAVLDRNPEGAAPRGNWADVDFLRTVWDRNDEMQDTQFADYHGHGWNFRAVFKRDREGNLLDAEGNIVEDTDPDKFDKAVHMSSIHMDVGMHCVDCHFAQDNHGNGHMYGEVALAVEVDCQDCHGTAEEYPNLYTSGPAALNGGLDLLTLRTPDGRRRFEWVDGELYQRASLDPDLEWKMSLVKDSVTEGHPEYNGKAARSKLMSTNTETQAWGAQTDPSERAHSYDKLECYACHTSWTTSCGGCHLPIEANRKSERHKYEGGETRNFATYNPQVARDQVFHLGRRSPANGGRIAPVRSTSALVLSSTNANREKIYVQQPPIASSGFSSQAFNPHFPHTVRKTETKECEDCHLSATNDNNAIMAQTLMYGTQFINFVGYHAYAGTDRSINAVQVTEWDEPQAVIGSYLHKYAYPDWYDDHQQKGMKLETEHGHRSGKTECLQLRGEYLFVAEGRNGMQAYDVASIANKGISQRIITAPFSPLGHDTQVNSANATCVALPTTQPIAPDRNTGDLMRIENMEQPFHPLYNYAYVSDSKEGLIVVDVLTLGDGEPRNNFLKRSLTWNPGNILKGARHITVAGNYLYITAASGLVIVDIDDPLQPSVVAQLELNDARATAVQFRYAFVTTANGLEVVDITDVTNPRLVENNVVRMADARKVFLSRTYAYVAAGKEGLYVINSTNPEKLVLHTQVKEGLSDSQDVMVATTNASLFAYVADGSEGLKVFQLTSPEIQPKFYGFSPKPNPTLIATKKVKGRMLSLSRPLERDRAVDESGNQIAVFGRRGSRPLNLEEMQNMFLNDNGKPWFVRNEESGE